MAQAKVPEYLTQASGDLLVDIYVAPRASRTAIAGEHDGRLKVQVAAPPVDGKANKQIIRYFASLLGVGRGDVEIASGASGRRKRLKVKGVDVLHFMAALGG